MSEPGPVIEFRSVHYTIDDGKALLQDVSFSVRRDETLMLLGRSGSGKTTCLKMINRLITPTGGEVLVEARPTTAWDPIQLRRRIGYAIQEAGLFPHYSVRKNIALVPSLERWDKSRIDRRVDEVMTLVGLPPAEYGSRYPHQLSGGQRQRVGLARALAAEPPILLMDEPFGALDPITRSELQMEFRKLQQTLSKTIVFVTHDVGEALLLGGRIALLESGRLRGLYSRDEFLHSQDETARSYIDVFRAGQHIQSTP